MQNPVFERIRQDIAENDIVVYMKGCAIFPQCSRSAAIVDALERMGAQYKDIDILLDPSLNQGLRDFTSTNEVPQLYVQGQYVCGGAALREGETSAAVYTLLRERNLIQR